MLPRGAPPVSLFHDRYSLTVVVANDRNRTGKIQDETGWIGLWPIKPVQIWTFLGIDTKALISYKCHALGFCHLIAGRVTFIPSHPVGGGIQ